MDFKSILYFTVLFVIRVNGVEKCDLTARPQCSSDCSKILACVSRVETPIFTINCSSSTPYCNKGHCVATPGNCSIKTHKTPILCTSEGVFPEPTECSEWHSCTEVGSKSSVSKCPNGRIFDSKIKSCVHSPTDNENICETISCNGISNGFITFPANPAFYAYCFTSAIGVQHTYMYKCDDETNKIFDETTKKCRFNCKSVGYVADPYDCSSYYICNGLKFASRYVHCPPNYYFNGTACLNSKAHCPKGSIVNTTSTMTTTTSTTTTTTTTASTTTASTSTTSTTTTSTPVANNSIAADELSVTSDSVTDEVTDTTTMSSIEFSTLETSKIIEPVTQTVRPHPSISTTRKPSGTIWKHMGLISVRVGRFFNLI